MKKFFLEPREASWWAWVVTAVLLVLGLTVHPVFFVAATALTAARTILVLRKTRSWAPYAVQIRAAYTLLLIVCYAPFWRWLNWLPCLGTFALLLFGYCLMARFLSLMPWNRTETFTIDLLRRTFISAPVVQRIERGFSSGDYPGGVCALESRAAQGKELTLNAQRSTLNTQLLSGKHLSVRSEHRVAKQLLLES